MAPRFGKRRLQMPPMRIPAPSPMRPVFAPPSSWTPDGAMDRAVDMYREFEPDQLHGDPLSMKWGDVRVGADNNLNRNCFDIPWVDVGPFAEPTELEVDMFIDPDPRIVASGGLPPYLPQWQWKAILGIGTGKMEQRVTTMQPRVFTCQSLTLFAADYNNFCVDPYRISVYVNRRRVSTFPRPFASDTYLMGIGTAAVQMNYPPRQATHMMVGRGSLTNISMVVRVGSGGGAIQEFTVNSGSGTVAVPNPIFPIVPDATTWTLNRSASAASDSYTVWWLR